MTETTSPALRTALAYYHAWTGHDLDKAMSYIAPDIVCDVPAGRLEGAGAYRAFSGPFGHHRFSALAALIAHVATHTRRRQD